MGIEQAKADLTKCVGIGGKIKDLQSLGKALRVIPDKDQHWVAENVFYFSTYGKTYGSRLSRRLCESREIIYLSEKIFPLSFDFTSWYTRLFIFIVLHETSHAKRQHKSRYYDEVSDKEEEMQEAEATSDAIGWFNSYAGENGVELLSGEEVATLTRKAGELVDQWEGGWGRCLAAAAKL